MIKHLVYGSHSFFHYSLGLYAPRGCKLLWYTISSTKYKGRGVHYTRPVTQNVFRHGYKLVNFLYLYVRSAAQELLEIRWRSRFIPFNFWQYLIGFGAIILYAMYFRGTHQMRNNPTSLNLDKLWPRVIWVIMIIQNAYLAQEMTQARFRRKFTCHW